MELWVSVFSSVGLFFFLVLSCSYWLSLIGFDLGFFLLLVLLNVFLLLLCMEYVLAIGIFCFEREPSSIMAGERESDESGIMDEWPSNGNKTGTHIN